MGEAQIIDYKTSQKKKTEKAIAKDIQLPYYFFLLSKSNDDLSNNIISGKFEYVRNANSPSVEVRFDEDDIIWDDDDDVEELKNALGENQKFNIIFTIGNPNAGLDDESAFMDFEEYQQAQEMNEDSPKNGKYLSLLDFPKDDDAGLKSSTTPIGDLLHDLRQDIMRLEDYFTGD